MSNRNFPSQRVFGHHLLPVRIDAQISIGATGAPTIQNGLGINTITRLSAGVYRIQLQDNYSQFLSFDATMEAPVTGASVAGGSFVATTMYQIITTGTTTQAQWETAGVPAGITAAPGVVFLAAGIGAGTGTVKAIGASGITSVEVMGDPQTMLSKQPYQFPAGAYITFKCLGPTAAGNTAPIATDPADGSGMDIVICLNNSSVQ